MGNCGRTQPPSAVSEPLNGSNTLEKTGRPSCKLIMLSEKSPLPLQRRGHGSPLSRAAAKALVLPAEEEEGLVPSVVDLGYRHRTAD